ncbi:MAG TPA: glutathione transferase GstA [Burkholderiales bacterium]|nr:glutathione transferase GstA [Burkholderiales bacterium]
MKLYYSPGACSLAVHITLREVGMPFQLEKVDLKTKRTEHGVDYLEVNPKGSIPALRLDSGDVLTEAAACLQYVADTAPDKRLAPLAGTMARYRLIEWLNYISSELHKTFAPLFHDASPERREEVVATLRPRFDYVAQHLASGDYLMGPDFTIADAYLYAVLNWTHFLKVDISSWPQLGDFLARVARRGTVQEAKKAEHLG